MSDEKILHYKLIKKLGAGGMGEVRLAEDLKLNRKVALKLLPEQFARDRKLLSRFLQEARLAANLNHPNICVIYEVCDEAETPFIAMEFIEGETLTEKIRSGELSFGEIIEIAVQISDALDEAHRRGIIHRDIKSANIIVNRRGEPKVLDFGLAKPFVTVGEVSDDADTQAKTEAGMLVGTVPYMSPEQALGKKLDSRTDLWSFGVLLYEMICGVLPFRGQTQAAVFDEILNKNPVLPHEINESVNPELEMIVLKLLQKDREFRYQTASDLRADLRRIRRFTNDVPAFDKIPLRLSSENMSLSRTSFTKVQTDKIGEGTIETIFGNKSSSLKTIFAAALIFGFAAIAVFFVYRNFQAQTSEASFEKTDAKRLTALGTVSDAVISPDGKYIVYVQDEGELKSLWLKQIATGSLFALVQPSAVNYQGLAFSPDGNWIYYNLWDRKSVGEIFRIPILGGVSEKIVHDCMPGVILSPDGKKVGFIRSNSKAEKTELIIADTANSQEEIIFSRGKGEDSPQNAAWSPDGNSIAVAYGRMDEAGKPILWISEIVLSDKSEKTIWTVPEKLSNNLGAMVWKPDRSGMLITLSEAQTPYNQIWSVNFLTGEMRQLTRDFNNYKTLSLTADGTKLVSLMQDYFASVWVVPVDAPNEVRKVTNGKIEGIGVSWMPDGRIIYASLVSGNLDIWTADANGENRKQLTTDSGHDLMPCASSDGKKIFFLSTRGGLQNLWQMNADGSDQKRVFSEGLQWYVSCPKKDDNIFFVGLNQNKFGFWKLPLATMQPEIVREDVHYRVGISNDGKKIASSVWNIEKQRLESEIIELETGKRKTFTLPPSAVGEQEQNESAMRWLADDRRVSFINQEKGVSNIWQYSPVDGKMSKLTNFTENYVFTYDWSYDGKKLAVTRLYTSADAVLIADIK